MKEDIYSTVLYVHSILFCPFSWCCSIHSYSTTLMNLFLIQQFKNQPAIIPYIQLLLPNVQTLLPLRTRNLTWSSILYHVISTSSVKFTTTDYRVKETFIYSTFSVFHHILFLSFLYLCSLNSVSNL